MAFSRPPRVVGEKPVCQFQIGGCQKGADNRHRPAKVATNVVYESSIYFDYYFVDFDKLGDFSDVSSRGSAARVCSSYILRGLFFIEGLFYKPWRLMVTSVGFSVETLVTSPFV